MRLKIFLGSDAGAVTVDWLVLTAAVFGLATGAIFAFDQSVTGLADAVDDTMVEIADNGFSLETFGQEDEADGASELD